MASQIRMTPEKMRQRAGEYTTQANNLNSIITKMDGLLKIFRVNGKVAQARRMHKDLQSLDLVLLRQKI